MNDAREVPPAPDPPGPGPDDDAFEPRRFRTLADMTRSRDNRLVAGVCAGAARHLGIDPVVVRVVVAVLTFVGLAGPILYVAAWFLVPSEDAERSAAARLFRLDENEPQVRSVGLLVAAVLAGLAVLGDGGWGWGPWPAFWALIWLAIPVGFVYWLLVVRRRPVPTSPAPVPAEPSATGSTMALPAVAAPTAPARATAPPFSWGLTLLTLSIGAIAVAVTYLLTTGDPLPATTYVAIALGIVAVGVLVGTVAGDAVLLVLLGIALAMTLVVGSFLPSLRTGEQSITPATAAQVQDSYEHGMGIITLDLTEVDDPTELLGRTIDVENGLGQMRVRVPAGLAIDVDAFVRAGDVAVLDRRESGTAVEVDLPTIDPGPVLRLELSGALGQIEVVQR